MEDTPLGSIRYVEENDEELLTGGNVSDRVVRIGATVRKPSTSATPSIHAFLCYLHSAGFEAAPESLGTDSQGRQVLEYIPGITTQDSPALLLPELSQVGQIIRRLHRVSSLYRPEPSSHWNVVLAPDGEELICHNDLAPWNLVRDGRRWVFIDWDGAGPATRLWDLAYAVITFLPIEPQGNLTGIADRLHVILDGYQPNAEERSLLPRLIIRRARAMYDLLSNSARTGQQPWARLYASGHAKYWGATADFVEQHLAFFQEAVL